MTRRVATGLALLILLAVPSPLRSDSAASKNNEGNRLYTQRRYEEALKMYTDAQASRPEAPELHFNIGNVLYRKGEFDKAMEEYRRAQVAEPSLAQRAAYNRGNALLMQGRLQDAVRAYVEALRARPDDADAKRNLELALRQIQQQEQRQSDTPQERKKDDANRPEGAPQQSEPGRPDAGGQKPARPRPTEMTEEEARQVLEALREEEKEGLRKHVRASLPEAREPESDW